MIFPESWLRDYCDPPLSAFEISNLLTMAGLEVEDLRSIPTDVGVNDIDFHDFGEEKQNNSKNNDSQFLLKLTPNFGHALSILGVARELSALTGVNMKNNPTMDYLLEVSDVKLEVSDVKIPSIKIEDENLCGRFVGRIISNVNSRAPTPHWIKDRLIKCGVHTVNILVDISNYVMLEYGCPSHIFDLSKINGNLTIRWAQNGESITTLNGKDISLTENIGVVSDDISPIAVAGIVGGKRASVSNSTKNIFIEVAYWWPEAIAGRAKELGISTDASHRFERGVDPQILHKGIERITQLITKYCNGTVEPVTDLSPNLPLKTEIHLRMSRLKRILGLDVARDRCVEIFSLLGFSVFTKSDEDIFLTPPSWRFDIKIEEDLIGEVARFVGYDSFPNTPPLVPAKFVPHDETKRNLHRIRQEIASLGYFEAINFSFVKKEWEINVLGNASAINLLNPISENMSAMRSNLMLGLIWNAKKNIDHQILRAKIFEIGRVFHPNPLIPSTAFGVHGIDQPIKIAGIAYGSVDPIRWDGPEKAVDFFDIKGDLEVIFSPAKPVFLPEQHPVLHPGRGASITIDGTSIGIVGEIHPRLRQFFDLPFSPIVFELQASALCFKDIPKYSIPPRKQSIWRDISLCIDAGVSYESIKNQIFSIRSKELIRSVQLFDLYKEKKQKEINASSYMAIRLELQNDKITLTEKIIEEVIGDVLQKLSFIGVRLRNQK